MLKVPIAFRTPSSTVMFDLEANVMPPRLLVIFKFRNYALVILCNSFTCPEVCIHRTGWTCNTNFLVGESTMPSKHSNNVFG